MPKMFKVKGFVWFVDSENCEPHIKLRKQPCNEASIRKGEKENLYSIYVK